MSTRGKHGTRTRRPRRALHVLLATGLAATGAATAAAPASAGDSLSQGGQYSVPVPAVPGRTVSLGTGCVTVRTHQHCVPPGQTTPATAQMVLTIVWSVVGESRGITRSVAVGQPAVCGGGAGITMLAASGGGHGTLALQALLDAGDGQGQQELLDESIPFYDNEGESIADLWYCFPAAP